MTEGKFKVGDRVVATAVIETMYFEGNHELNASEGEQGIIAEVFSDGFYQVNFPSGLTGAFEEELDFVQ